MEGEMGTREQGKGQPCPSPAPMGQGSWAEDPPWGCCLGPGVQALRCAGPAPLPPGLNSALPRGAIKAQ